MLWCPGEDSNFHGLAATGTWSQRVYQFRHLGSDASGGCLNRVPTGRENSFNHAGVKLFWGRPPGQNTLLVAPRENLHQTEKIGAIERDGIEMPSMLI